MTPTPAGSNALSAVFTVPGRRDRATQHYVCFVLAGQELALPILAVQQIDRPLPLRALSAASPTILGAVQVRGRTVPVLDLARRLGLGQGIINHDQRMLFLEVHGRSIALCVDRLSEMLPAHGEIVPLPAAPLPVDPACVAGMLNVNGRSLILLNPDGLISASEVSRLHPPG